MVLRLALCTPQKLVKSGSLHPVKVITRATSLLPSGGPPVAGLNGRPYFPCRGAMNKHIQHLASYCESAWTLRKHMRTSAHRPYVYRHRWSQQEVEEARLQRALTGSLNAQFMPSSCLSAKGGRGTANFAGFLTHSQGGRGCPSPLHTHT